MHTTVLYAIVYSTDLPPADESFIRLDAYHGMLHILKFIQLAAVLAGHTASC
jgi:hypothetical protein